MFKSNKTKIIDEIVTTSKKLVDDCRYDKEDVPLRLEHLDKLIQALEIISKD